MVRRAKTPRFKEYQSLPGTLDAFAGRTDTAKILGPGPYVLEIGCGRGELVLELARRYPGQKFIGVDIKSDRMWFGAKRAKAKKLDNLVFLRADATALNEVFALGSISAIWLTFPDPFPKKRQAKHRLTGQFFLEIYESLLQPDGRLYFKTDNRTLFDWSLEQFASQPDWTKQFVSRDLHADLPEHDDKRIMTSYERRFMADGKVIFYAELAKI